MAALSLLQIRADLRDVSLEALSEKTPEGKQAMLLRSKADRLLERCEQV